MKALRCISNWIVPLNFMLLSSTCDKTEAFCILKQSPKNRHLPSIIGRDAIIQPLLCSKEVSRKDRITLSLSNPRSIEKDNEEPLSVIFQRAMVLQRAGSYDEALKSYELFCRAAEQCNVDKSQYSEVLINMGAIYLKKGDNNSKEQAKHYFTTALKYRQNGMAHVNLAVLNLQQATSSSITTTDLTEEIKCLKTAKDHCDKAIKLNDDPRTVQTAKRLLSDIENMLNQVQ